MSLPPFSQSPDAPHEHNVVTPDFRKMNRAVVDADGANPLFRLKAGRHDPDGADVYWQPLAPGGVPCFPRAYDDQLPRTPDMRDPERVRRIGPHPRRTLIHVRPPQGVFHDALPTAKVSQTKLNALLQETSVIRAEDLLDFDKLGDGITGPAVIAEVPQRLNLPNREVAFEGIRFYNPKGPVSLRGAANTKVQFIDCAVHTVTLPNSKLRDVSFRAENSIFETIIADTRMAEMEYCTVMDGADFARLNASDCLFNSLVDTLICDTEDGQTSCIRYSRLAARDTSEKVRTARCLDAMGGTNTTAIPQFVERWHRIGKTCEKRPARYGEAGYGVLDTDTGAAITAGAEDEGELGVGHGLHHAAGLRALRRKLESFLPLGQEIAIFYDPMLALSPPISGSLKPE